MVADPLAKNSINHEYEIVEFDHPPIHATCAFLGDLGEVTRARRSGTTFTIRVKLYYLNSLGSFSLLIQRVGIFVVVR